MLNNVLQKGLETIYQGFKKDTAKMLIYTGTIGWALSSFAQILGIASNKKISSEQKSFLVPQELFDAVFNIGCFFAITKTSQAVISKLVSTGKLVPKSIRNFINNNELYKNKVGKLSFDLGKVLAKEPKQLRESYNTYKNYVATVGTVGASVLASNVITPVTRNYFASEVQKYYINKKQDKPVNYSSGMKI